MNYKNLLFSAVQFFLVLVMCCAGFFFIALPWAPSVRFKWAAFLVERDDIFIPMGSILLALGVILGIGFYFLQKRAYFQIAMKPPVEVEIEVLQGILERYWKTIFPQESLKTDAIMHPNQKIELVAELPFADKKLLKKIEHEVGSLLARQLGYKKEFLFTVVMK